jgi:uroporphyrinogen-III synthase
MTTPVFITRPAHQAAALAAEVARRGFTPILAPCLRLKMAHGPMLDMAGIAGIAVTSANAVAALVTRMTRRDLPVYAVGAATGAAARHAGFEKVEIAAGDAPALAAFIAARVTPGDGAILYPSGEETAYDLPGALDPAGIPVVQIAAYDMPVVASLPKAALDLLDRGAPALALLMSVRTATAFGGLATAAGRSLKTVTALCLSSAVAEAANAWPFARTLSARAPNQAALLELLETQSPPQ